MLSKRSCGGSDPRAVPKKTSAAEAVLLLVSALTLAGTLSACGDHAIPFELTDAGRLPPLTADVGPTACIGLQCARVSCTEGRHTTVSGIVFSPSQMYPDPIYGATVYVPNAPLAPFTPGVTCDRCGAPISGSPISIATTGPDGSFILHDVPVGGEIPIVIQVGRWRKQINFPVDACKDNRMPDVTTHLPANQAEGDIPRIAIATGAIDPLECLLLKMGVDPNEFTPPSGNGRIHVYQSNGASLLAPTPPASALWSSLSTLKKYDTVLLPCEKQPFYKPAAATQNLIDYTTAGGRVFTTHYGYVWIQGAQAPFPSTAVWTPDGGAMPDPLPVTVNQTFPKGNALADWLANERVSPTPTPGHLLLDNSHADVASVIDPALAWLTSDAPNASAQQFTFNTPIGVPADQQCGRVAYSDFHVSWNNLTDTSLATFPLECEQGDAILSPQEKVLEFMLFDLASCIQDEMVPPTK